MASWPSISEVKTASEALRLQFSQVRKVTASRGVCPYSHGSLAQAVSASFRQSRHYLICKVFIIRRRCYLDQIRSSEAHHQIARERRTQCSDDHAPSSYPGKFQPWSLDAELAVSPDQRCEASCFPPPSWNWKGTYRLKPASLGFDALSHEHSSLREHTSQAAWSDDRHPQSQARPWRDPGSPDLQ